MASRSPSTWRTDDYEHAYGYSILDELHNFFPELLYDDVIFPEPRFQFFRHRMQLLFPRAYTQSVHHYGIYQAVPRQTAFYQFSGSAMAAVPPPPPPPTQVLMPPAPLTRTAAAISTIHALSPPPPLPTRRNEITLLEPDASSHLFTSFFNRSFEHPLTTTAALRILGSLNPLFEDVAVTPSQLDVESASLLCDLDRIPADTNCAICQDRGEATPWRRLNCGHAYHRACIDPWFERNVVCPVCRADIRTLASAATAATAVTAAPPMTGGGSARPSSEFRS